MALFSGKIENLADLVGSVLDTKKVIGIGADSGFDPLTFASLGTAYESELTSASITKFTENLVSNNLPNIETLKFSNAFKVGSSPVPFFEYEQKMMQKPVNYFGTNNPLQYSSGLFSFGQLLSDLFDDAESKAEEVDQVRLRVHDLISTITTTTEVHTVFLDEMYTTYKNALDLNYIRYFLDNYVNLLEGDGSLRDQLIDYKELINTLKAKVTLLANEITNTYHIASIETIRTSLTTLVGDIDSLLVQEGETLDQIMTPLSSLVDYTANGEDNILHTYRTTQLSDFYKNSVFKNVKSDYARQQVPSISSLATSYGNNVVTRRSVVDNVQAALPQATTAVPDYGVGDQIQSDQPVDTIPLTGTVGPLDESDYNLYVNTLGTWESGNDYSKVNSIGFCGRWQFGSGALIEAGLVKDGTSTRSLKSTLVWTGRSGISSRASWLSNSSVQDTEMLIFTRTKYKRLLANGALKKTDTKTRVAGMLAAAHLKGAGGARKFANGIDNSDAYGTKASTYYNNMVAAFGGDTSPANATDAETNMLAVDTNTIPDSATINVPSQSAAPIYPYNIVREFEAGHFEEVDSTPGRERIQMRHKTGTGHEYKEDGSAVYFSTGDHYTATLGNDYIVVSGYCQIYVSGDVGITAGGDFNLNAKNDFNILAGGNFNVKASGDMNLTSEGSARVKADGDLAINSGGFMKQGADGDMQIEGGSATIASRSGSLNILSKDTLDIVTVGKLQLSSTGEVSMASAGDLTVSSGGQAALVGESAVVEGYGSAVLASSGKTSLVGSGSIATSVPVENAKAAETASAAPLGVYVPIPNTGSGDDGGKGADAQTRTSEDLTTEAAEEFVNADYTETQSYGGGGGGADSPASTKKPLEK